MSKQHFGTDGIRGVANETLTPELAFNLGQATARWMDATRLIPRVVIGRDTRRSGPMLESALSAGFASAGVDVVSLGVAPTPTISFAARTGNFGLGVIVSASHNPAPDNGIKYVGHDGRKLPDSSEVAIEAELKKPLALRPIGPKVGSIVQDDGAIESYLRFLAAIVPEGLDGISVAVDAAHGAAYQFGPEILRRLGANVTSTGTEPDGMNINALGGATKPATVCQLTQDALADIGVAFDGDADRAIFSDEKGVLLNGDRTIAIWSAFQKELGDLDPAVVVGTVMSNGGFEAYMSANGIELLRAPVGDKYVAEQIEKSGALIGGEQSGHIIFPRRGPTGDGLVTMLELLRVIRRSGKTASELAESYTSWPQILVNITTPSPKTWDQNTTVAEAVRWGESKLGGRGRVNVRASGTQPMVRVMVEADEYSLRDEVAQKIVSAFVDNLEGKIYGEVDLTNALGD